MRLRHLGKSLEGGLASSVVKISFEVFLIFCGHLFILLSTRSVHAFPDLHPLTVLVLLTFVPINEFLIFLNLLSNFLTFITKLGNLIRYLVIYLLGLPKELIRIVYFLLLWHFRWGYIFESYLNLLHFLHISCLMLLFINHLSWTSSCIWQCNYFLIRIETRLRLLNSLLSFWEWRGSCFFFGW